VGTSPFTTSYDNSAYGTQAGESSGPDDKSSLWGQTSILSNILPGHASVTDAVTRLQRERDLALRRIDELHEYYKKETERKAEADRKGTLISIEVRNSMIRDAQKETAHYKTQFENEMSLVETQKLSIKMLQDELGEEAEFDAEETAQMRSVRRECETRVNNYEDRIASRNPITTHWTIDWDVATIIEALEELYPLQAEHKHLDFGTRWRQVVEFCQ